MRTEIGGDEIICRQLCPSGYAVLFVEVNEIADTKGYGTQEFSVILPKM